MIGPINKTKELQNVCIGWEKDGRSLSSVYWNEIYRSASFQKTLKHAKTFSTTLEDHNEVASKLLNQGFVYVSLDNNWEENRIAYFIVTDMNPDFLR